MIDIKETNISLLTKDQDEEQIIDSYDIPRSTIEMLEQTLQMV